MQQLAAARTRTNTPSFSRDDHRYSTTMRRRTKRKASFMPRVFDGESKTEEERDENLDERVLTESDAGLFRTQESKTDAAGIIDRGCLFCYEQHRSFRQVIRVGEFKRRQRAWFSVSPPSDADPIIKKTERLGLKYELLASGSRRRK